VVTGLTQPNLIHSSARSCSTVISSPSVCASWVSGWITLNGLFTVTVTIFCGLVLSLKIIVLQSFRYTVGRLVTTQIAAGRGTERLTRSSARQLYWFVRHRSVPASVVPPYGSYMISRPILIQPTTAPPWRLITDGRAVWALS
jgi:hypothetical protein